MAAGDGSQGIRLNSYGSFSTGAPYDFFNWKRDLQCIATKHHTEISNLVLQQQRIFFDMIRRCPLALDSSTELVPCSTHAMEFVSTANGHDIKDPPGIQQIDGSGVAVVSSPQMSCPEGMLVSDRSDRADGARIDEKKDMELNSSSINNCKDACMACGGQGHSCRFCQPDEKTRLEEDPAWVLSVNKECDYRGVDSERSAASQHSTRGSVLEKFRKRVSLQSSFIKQEQTEGGGCFDTFVGVIILLNATLLIVSSEWAGWLLSVELGIQTDDGTWQHAPFWFEALEQGFTAFFVLELIYQLCIQRSSFFKDRFNWVDASVVTINAAEMYVLKPLEVKSLGHVTILRLMRMAKLIRTLRIIRTVKFFSGLRVLVRAVISSLVSLLWSMVLLAIFIMIGGLLMTKLLEEFIRNSDNAYDVRLWCWTYYGTPLRAMYTMFEVTLAGCWPNYVRPLLADVNHYYGVFFLLYISFVVFAVIRVITAIFLKETLDAASNDATMMIAEKMHKRNGYLKKLEAVFKHADTSGDGELSADEFDRVLQDPTVKMYLSALELEVHETSLLFELLDNGDGSISYDEFVQGISRLKGSARALDLVALQMDMKKVLKLIDRKSRWLSSLEGELVRSPVGKSGKNDIFEQLVSMHIDHRALPKQELMFSVQSNTAYAPDVWEAIGPEDLFPTDTLEHACPPFWQAPKQQVEPQVASGVSL